MPQKRIMQATGQIFKGFWKWHVDNIGLMAGALVKSQRVGITAIGRELGTKTSAKQAIKRVDKFLSNDKVPLLELLGRWISWVIGPRK